MSVECARKQSSESTTAKPGHSCSLQRMLQTANITAQAPLLTNMLQRIVLGGHVSAMTAAHICIADLVACERYDGIGATALRYTSEHEVHL